MSANELSKRSPQMRRRASIAILVAFSMIIIVQRIRLMNAPLFSDICAYAMIGHEMLHGRQLYTDLWERKPPLLYISYAAAELITGYGPGEVFLLGTTVALASLIMLHRVGQTAGGPIAGMMVAGFCTLLNTDLRTMANQPIPEVLINFWMIAAFLLLVGWPLGRRLVRAVLLGLLFSAATLCKHNSVLACGTLAMGHLIASRSARWVNRLIEIAVAGGVVGLIWLAMLGYFASLHRAGDFIDVLFTQNVSYSGGLAVVFEKALRRTHLYPAWMVWAIAPAGLLLVLTSFSLYRRQYRPGHHWWLLFAWALGTWPTVAATGYLSPLYYLLWLPIGCIAGGWAGAAIVRGPACIPSVIAFPVVSVAFGFLLIRQGTEFLLTPDEWVHQQLPNYNLSLQKNLGIELGHFLQPNECFWHLGDDNNLYFYAKKSPPSGLLFIDPFLYGRETQKYWARLLRDLNRTKPVLVVLQDNYSMLFPRDAPIFGWLRQNYVPWYTPLGWPDYKVMVRRGSGLAKRVQLNQSATSP